MQHFIQNFDWCKPLRISFDKVNGFIRVYDGTKYFLLFSPEKYNATFNRIRYLIGAESGITYIFSHNYARIKIHSYDSLPLEETLTIHDVILHSNSVLREIKITTTIIYF